VTTTRSLWRRGRRAAAGAAAAAVLAMTAQAGAAIAARPGAASPALRAPARTAAHPPGRAPRLSGAEQARIRRQVPLVQAADLIRNAVPSGGTGGYAGIGLRHGVIVWWKGRLPARMAAVIGAARRIAPVRVRPAAHSAAELQRAADRLWAAAGLPHGGPLIGIRLPFDGSGITAAVAQGRAQAPAAVAAALPGVGVPVRVTAMAPASWTGAWRCDDSPPWWGGGAILNATLGGPGLPCGGNASLPYECTAGFAAIIGSSQYLTTAGHCGYVGDTFTDPTGQTIGPMAYSSPGDDLALIRTSADGHVWDGVPGSGDFVKPVYGWAWPFAGESLCFSGTSSGPVCGDTVDNMWHSYCGTDSRGNRQCFANLMSMAGTADLHGDSGGPVFALDSTLTKDLAVGGVSGSMTQGSGQDLTSWTLFAQFGTAIHDFPGLIPMTATSALYAPTVTVLANNTQYCPGNQQYFTATDYSGNQIAWTYANGSHQCVQVTYYPTDTPASCSYSFYVPDGDATGKINFVITTLVNGSPRTTSVTVDEAPISGFTHLFTGSHVIAIGFGDNNGVQQYPVKLGWGSSVDHSLQQAC
jgi:hypothetical protein